MSTNAKLPTCDIKTNLIYLELFLDQLGVNLTGNIIVMLSRMWDVSAVIGRYLSTDFVVSDAKGNMIHCSTKVIMSHNFLRLKERGIYSVKNFAVKPNKDEYRILKNDAYMIEFYRSTTIRKVLVKANGFVRYPFQLQDFDGIESSDNKYLIGSRNMDFHLANHRGHSIRVILWGSLGDVLIEKKPNRLTITFHCKVTIDGIRTRKGWNFPSCGGDTCKKALTRQDGQFFCQSCNRTVDYRVLRYRLEVDVSHNTAQAVVVMFNKTATALVNCSADSLMDTMDEILPSEGIDESVGSSNLDDYPDNQPQKMKRIVQDPSIVTPSRPVEERKKSRIDVEDSEIEDSSDSANAKGKKGVVEPSAKKKKNRYIHSIGCTFTYVQLHVRLYQHANLYSDH
nr:hypothetical protein [Tanacetum cinerariifolium]